MSWMDDVADAHDHEIKRMDGFDDCCIGLVDRYGMNPVFLYDRAKVIAKMMGNGMSEEEAEEFYEFNQLGAYVGEGTPAFLVVRAPGTG